MKIYLQLLLFQQQYFSKSKRNSHFPFLLFDIFFLQICQGTKSVRASQICLHDLDQQLEKSYITINDAIASFEYLRLQPTEPVQLIHEQIPQTNPFKIKLKLEDIIIHQVNEIQQHQKLETKVLQVKEGEQEIVQAYIKKEDLYEILIQINNIDV
ncbi:unnamed protein product [Paramecium octaurelia]|uniref:Uncharacterized protein n=1 Tax=Paramecium octaurelia TaxID=43137 RepID=A0A8S1YMK3_PAROT|nr:unnamed protein product [Paramecium octaurelia]